MTAPFDLKRILIRAIIIGVICGIIFTVYYALVQRPPYYVATLDPVVLLLFFIAIGMFGAWAAYSEKKVVSVLSGAMAGAVAGAISSIALIVLHNIHWVDMLAYNPVTALVELLYYLITGSITTVIIAIATMILGIIGGSAFALAAWAFDAIKPFGRYRL